MIIIIRAAKPIQPLQALVEATFTSLSGWTTLVTSMTHPPVGFEFGGAEKSPRSQRGRVALAIGTLPRLYAAVGV
jgi:hypothetical protein